MSFESDEFEVIDQLEASLSPEDVAKLQAWLQPTDYGAQSSEFHRHLSSQAPGTGLWICETSKYQQWQESVEHGSLWIKGAPGAGKSVTAASMVKHLQETENTPVLYFFFRHIISANRRPRCLIRDFLAQLLPHSVRLQASLQPLLDTHLDDLSDEGLWAHLLIGLSSAEKVYCIVDALDEAEFLPGDGLLDRLNNLATFRPNRVKLLMTSRPKQYLQSSLRDSSIVHISLEDDLVGKDITLFLTHRLKTHLPQENQLELAKALVSAISERANGLFLYARLLLDQIIPSLGEPKLNTENLVKGLPVGLEEMYNSMLFQQAEALKINVKIQVFLLEFATHTSRALRLNELASVLASSFPPSMLPGNPKSVARLACAPLLEISEDETVQVIHHSFTEFLLDSSRSKVMDSHIPQFPILNVHDVHKRLSIACLDYLRSGSLRPENAVPKQKRVDDSFLGRRMAPAKDITSEDGYDYQEAKLRYPFLEYAIGGWAFHASKYDVEDKDFFRVMAEFLDSESVDFKKWLQLEWWKGPKPSDVQVPTALHVAAFAGLTTYSRRLIEEGTSIDPRDSEDRTPLHWACARGHSSMASLLLGSGAIPDPEDCRGVKPIHEAARKNYTSIVKMLLEAKVDPLTPKTRENVNRRMICGDISTKGETAVEYVCLQGHTETILAMIPFLKPKTLEEMLCQCSRYGKFEAVRAILEHSTVSPNSVYDGATALFLACRAHNPAIVELLLAKGADANQTSEWQKRNRNCCGRRVIPEKLRTNVHGVLIGWKSSNNIACQEVLRLLVNAGADLEGKDADGNTPLISLFKERSFSSTEPPQIAATRELLRAGAKATAVTAKGVTALHSFLSTDQNMEILKLLFEFGAQAHTLGKNGDTAIHRAFKNIYGNRGAESIAGIINFLLAKGARCDVKNKKGLTAIEVASHHRCTLETFMLLLEGCSDLEVLKRCMWNLSYQGSTDEVVKFIQVLQDRGVSLEDRDSEGCTVLLKSIRSHELFSAFLQCGADLHVLDSKGQGVLHHFVSVCGSYFNDQEIDTFESLVKMGLDPLKVDNDGNNLLHVVAEFYTGNNSQEKFLRKILEYGISVNSKNKRGLTPLHIYLENYDFNAIKGTTDGGFSRRFDERFELPLLKVFQCNKETADINAQDVDGVTIFHLAALHSETLVFYLVDQGADPYILTKNERNALHLACRARQSNVVGYLCHTYPTMINHRDSSGRSPLHDACASGRYESVRALLQAGAKISTVDNNKRTPLHSCAEYADEERLWTLLARKNGPCDHQIQDRFRPSPKDNPFYQPWYTSEDRPGTLAIVQDNPSITLTVKELLVAGSNVLASDSFRRTPLDLAIEYDCQEMVNTLKSFYDLVHEKWNLKSNDLRMQTIMQLKGPNLSKLALSKPSSQEIVENLSTYLPFLQFDDIEWISKNGGNITCMNESTGELSSQPSLVYVAASKGFTSLMRTFGDLAVFNDNPETVQARLKDLPDADNSQLHIKLFAPTLYVACGRELPNMDMIKLLVEECGVRIDAHALVEAERWAKIKEFVEGGTALHVLAKAKYWWQLEALRYLLKHGAQIDAKNENGETPLHIACTGYTYPDMNCTNEVYGFWRIECVKILLNSGADVNDLDKNRLSCLHKACTSPQIMRILLEHGADINLGKLSPIFPTIQMQCLETLTILLDAGADPNAIDENNACDGFAVDWSFKERSKSALSCASFANLHNQQAKNSRLLVKLLIERGANIYAPISDSETLVHYVFEYAEYEIVCGFLDLSDKIDFNARDHKGRTIFLAACEWLERHWDAKAKAPFLVALEFGADPMAVDNNNRNALHHLLDNNGMGDDAINQFLAYPAASALLRQKDGSGFTPLNCALRSLRPSVVQAIVNMKEDLLSADPTGATALHRIAAQYISKRAEPRKGSWGRDHGPGFYSDALILWKMFLSLGGSINVRDKEGSPPLFYYLSSPQRNDYDEPEDSCCHLENLDAYFSEEVAKNLDWHAKNNDGENALHVIARRAKNQQTKPKHDKMLFQFFMSKGLNPLEEDGKGRSSLDIAAACEQKGILELFQYRK
ncbi:ankyrin repeat-containing domain protein [Tricladium varicosporioides]|nr:ankyrin repeat-containing domain protein [Hymenoscyphus varicosporioides]